MKSKKIYVPCELKVVRFNVEAGYAISDYSVTIANFTNTVNLNSNGSNSNRNEGYLNQAYKWDEGSREDKGLL